MGLAVIGPAGRIDHEPCFIDRCLTVTYRGCRLPFRVCLSTRPRLSPERLGGAFSVYSAAFPKGLFIPAVMQFAVMDGAERDGPLVAGFETPRAGLDEHEVMGLCWQTPADEAGLRGDETQVILVPNSPGRGYRENTLVNASS